MYVTVEFALNFSIVCEGGADASKTFWIRADAEPESGNDTLSTSGSHKTRLHLSKYRTPDNRHGSPHREDEENDHTKYTKYARPY